jgi:predicted RNA-binding protein with PUA-like domain
MAHWLIKSEPASWSWQQQVAAGAAGTPWNGVRNHQAKLHLMAMKVGDEAFFYHSNEGKEIVGIVSVTKPFYPDPTDASGKFGMVDVAAVKPFATPVSLAAIKREPKLAEMVLVTNSRLSVQPVREAEWKIIAKMGGI